MIQPSSLPPRHVWSYIITHLKPFRSAIFVMFWVACFWAVDLSLRPYLLKIILNLLTTGAANSVFEDLTIPVAIYLSMYFVMTSSFRLYGYFVELKMIPRLRQRIADHALNLLLDKSHTYYQNNFSGSLTNKVNDLTRSVPDIIQIVIDRFFSHLLALFVAIGALWMVDVRFAVFMLIWAGVFTSVATIISKRLTTLSDDWSERGSHITGRITDVLSNILSVRLFTAKEQEKQNLHETFEGAVQAEQKLQWSYFWMWFFYGYSFFILQILNFYFLMKGRQEGWITVGDFALVLVINLSIIDFMWQVAREFSEFSKLYGQITQALRAILAETEVQDKPNATELIIKQGEIQFSNVRFHYQRAEPLFQKKSVTIKAGQKVGLVGYSGGGKSTFVNLILRLYDITDGQILIDGQDIRTVTQESLRQHIAMIPQDPFLFHRTLMENIRYGRRSASDAEVIESAKRAHAHEFINNLPDGYQSMVGERGVKLSGGQRQRIAIARAILKNAPILILDEATSQLDSLTESEIQASLWELMQDKTTIVIAHRLSTLLHMDRILVFDQGKIIEDGPHAALIEKGGLFKTLWNAQVGGFLPDHKP
jgi:ATP-binding cassette, subfamily B, bacterial